MSKKPIHAIGILKDSHPCKVCKKQTKMYNPENEQSICMDCYFGVKK